MDGATDIDRSEIARFEALAADWWDPAGPMRPLHAMNPLRLGWIREIAIRHFGRDEAARRPFAGLRAVDVGCGAGLVCEPLARLGAEVTGIDAGERGIAAACAHAAGGGLKIDYRVATAADLVRAGASFDLVLALEVIEHVPDRQRFVTEIAALVRPGGLAVLSTLNRTSASWLAAVVAAEYLLGWLEPGTHDWRRFVRPAELARMLRQNGLRTVALTGVGYDAAHDRFVRRRDTSVNYMLAAVRDAA